uniref:Microtubule-associated protein futsch n=1 Tax=Anopheles atroparvus TaxID=41427 RepID=A0A182IVM1_ANOAO
MVTSTTATCVEQQSATELSSRPESAASHQSATEQNVEPSSVIMQETSHTTQIYSESASKEPSRPASAASDKSAANETRKDVNFAKFEESISRRESSSTPASKEERPTSVLSDGEEEEEDTQEKICLKETRSKSMSAVMSSNVQRVGFEGSTLGVLEESMVTSRDDLDMLRSPRDSVTKIEPSFTQKLGETTSTSVAAKSFKPLFDEAPQFPAAKEEEGQKDRETESTSMFPRCGLDSAESPEHGSSIAQGMDQLLKQTVNTMKEIEKMTSSVITSTVQATKEESSAEASKSVTATGLAFPVSCAADSGKSSPYLGDKSHESSAKSVSPQPDKDSLDESSTSLNTFIEKDSLSEGISKQLQKEQQKEQVSIRMSPVGESTAEPSVTVASQKASDELLFAGSKTPPTAPISPNVAVKEEGSHGAIITQSQTECSTLPGSTSAITVTASTAANTATVPKDDASGISTPKESVPSGKSSPGLMSVHTQGSTDSASKSINLGHSSSGIETSDSSPKPTSPFPKVVVVDTLKLADEAKTTSGMSTPDMTRSSTPDMVDSQIERIAPAATSGEKSDSQQTFTTTTTTTKTTTYIIKDGKKIEVDSNVHSDTVSEQTKASGDPAGGSIPAGSSVTTSSTTTTTYIIKDGQKVEGDSISTTKPSIPAQLTLAGTEQHGLAEDYDEKEVLSPRSDISSGQASRIVAAWHDEDVPGSPMSVTSQAPLSPSTKYTYDYDLQHSSSGVSKKSDIEIDQDSQDDIVPPQYGSDEARAAIPLASSFKPDPMSTSFYGQLPEVTMPMATKTLASSTTRSVPIPIAGSGKELAKTYVEYASSGDSSVDSSHKQSFPSDSDRKYLDDADLDFEKTFSRGKMEDLMTTSMHFASEKEFMAATTTAAQAVLAQKLEMDFTSTGLPSSATTTTVVASAQPTITPTAPPQSQAQSQSTMQPQSTAPQSTQPSAAPSAPSGTASSEVKSVLDAWGKPLSLPSPAPMATEDNKTTPKKERRMLMSKTKLNNEKNLRKRAESPTKATAKKPASPVYVDLSYVPHHGNSYYANVEFFKRVRARYYVFSGTEPSREVYNALLEAKQTWEDKELEVTIIPTYDTDVLGYWVSENEELLAKFHIDLSPSAARCTINLQDHETSCSAYRLEF